MSEPKKDKKFIKLPKYPGGKAAFQEFIRKNLKYPPEALKNKIEGAVHIKYRVNGLGKVVEAKVIHGLGYGCDEEALRLIWLLKYEKAKNRGLRVTAAMKTRINFKLPQKVPVEIKYEVKKEIKPKTSPEKAKPEKVSYNYIIEF
ncbi:MAG TPA: energy transducer TonB [Bacteroidales bacterium]|jgi:TonB family protein|nr:TonB family protein [Bacteroidales bacterium]NLH33387.1 TonB family protein [Lentimicrobium sp.]OQC38693.1 MAG: Gram-negative bacterial tonB protein [Bacteroidetes bacterium ADurb.Bin041]MBP7874112.1 TonB family protein [Bacteroidales bacterium]MCZ2282326.1 energy transducer TonB [Bacteroidales bacterium]